MATTNERLRDRSVSHAIGLERLKGGVVRRIIGLLNEVDADLTDRIRRNLEDGPSLSRTRLESILSNVRAINREGYIAIDEALTDELTAIAGYEPEFQVRMLADEIPVNLSFERPSRAQLQAIVESRPFGGRYLREWSANLRDSQFSRIQSQMRIGMVEGDTIDQLVRRIRGTRANRYRDGILEIGRRDAQAVVRTAVTHVAAEARETLYGENADVIKGVQWVSTLDSRTTLVCASRDGQVYPVNEGPRPPAHVGCRSSSIPITKSWRELGLDLDDAPPGTRASMDGQVPASTTYEEWLRRQPSAVQDEVLGANRARLFREGELSIDSMVRDDGRTWTLDELRRRELGAFESAGLVSRPPAAPVERIAVGNARITPQQRDAIADYAAGGFMPVNRHLRGVRPGGAAVETQVATLDAALEGAELGEGATVYRGILGSGGRALEQVGLRPGSVIVERGFLSTSRSRSVAGAFSEGSRDGILMSITAGPQARAIDIASLAEFGEREVLFARNQRLRVVKWDRRSRLLEVELLDD